MPDLPALSLSLEPAALRPLIEAVVEAVLSRTQQVRETARMAFTEIEAATLIGLKRHQLRDERLRGRIAHSTGPRGTILYSADDLREYLSSSREAVSR